MTCNVIKSVATANQTLTLLEKDGYHVVELVDRPANECWMLYLSKNEGLRYFNLDTDIDLAKRDMIRNGALPNALNTNPVG